MQSQLSFVEYYGYQENSRCGYCHQAASFNSHGMHAYTMSLQDYQDLIDRGWRRSGAYVYKPNNQTTCCPAYTIRCDSENFKLTKSQKKVLKKMNKFLADGIRTKNSDISKPFISQGTGISDEPNILNRKSPKIDITEIIENKSIPEQSTSKSGNVDTFLESNSLSSPDFISRKIQPPRKKAKQIRLEKKKMKLHTESLTISESNILPKKNTEKLIEDFLNSNSENDQYKLNIILVPSSEASTEKSYQLYKKYQIQIHKDDPNQVTRTSFERFLVHTPLKSVRVSGEPEINLGSFHQQYWINETLIAVGVIDILPYCVSSVYFFYDPDYAFLSLGTYSTLREISFTRQLLQKVPNLKYYYMGFYIHTCPKMIYKGKFCPAYLLCPEAYTWHLLTDEIRQKLNQAKYQRLNENPSIEDENKFSLTDLDSVLVYTSNGRFTKYRNLIQKSEDKERDESILEYGQLVGRAVAHRIVYY